VLATFAHARERLDFLDLVVVELGGRRLAALVIETLGLALAAALAS
jgi:hypothetical protein